MNNLDEFLDSDIPDINKDIDTVGADTPFRTDLSILDLIEEKSKITKKMTPVYLDEETLIKLKTVAYKHKISVANLLETTIKNLTQSIEINKKVANLYDKQIKGNRGRKKVSE